MFNRTPSLSFARGRVRFVSRRAFTLIELLVVVAITGLLASMLLPAVTQAKAKAHALQCLNHKRQLALAWQLYADDHDGKLVPNRERSSESWVRGVLDFDNANPDNTNTLYLVDARYAKMGAYVKSPATFTCPDDRSQLNYSGRKLARVRSVSMNHAMGALEAPGQLPFADGWMVFRTTSDLPAPASLWVMIDEHADSLDDGRFVVDSEHRKDQAQFISVPANYHRRGATLSFADGHAEIHRWADPGTLLENKYCGCVVHYVAQGFYTRIPHSVDVAWLQERTTTKVRN